MELALVGIVKGAIAAGVPSTAMSVPTTAQDVHFAVAVLRAPNLVANMWQALRYRFDLLPSRFLINFVLGNAAVVTLGTNGLTSV
jgi:hypothetical protein